MTDKHNEYDLVISDGRVIDPESGLDAVRNVGIKGDKIAVVTEQKIQGKETIDVKGHVVAPGFIDMHQHNVGIPFGEKVALRDGVTTPMELEAGVYPIDEFYAALEGKSVANYGASVGTLAVREHILNPEYRTKFAGFFIWDLMAAPKESKATMHWSTDVATPATSWPYVTAPGKSPSRRSRAICSPVGRSERGPCFIFNLLLIRSSNKKQYGHH